MIQTQSSAVAGGWWRPLPPLGWAGEWPNLYSLVIGRGSCSNPGYPVHEWGEAQFWMGLGCWMGSRRRTSKAVECWAGNNRKTERKESFCKSLNAEKHRKVLKIKVKRKYIFTQPSKLQRNNVTWQILAWFNWSSVFWILPNIHEDCVRLAVVWLSRGWVCRVLTVISSKLLTLKFGSACRVLEKWWKAACDDWWLTHQRKNNSHAD